MPYLTQQNEKAILAGVEFDRNEKLPLEESLEELERLVETAGAKVVGKIFQHREKPDQRYFLGKGKLEELAALCLQKAANLVIFDAELSPSQERNLEDRLGIKVIDRTELILDIFAQHAKSREGKLQVELAQANFLLTRLTGWGVLLSRLGGGIGTRGPGETKLEMDRRRIKKKISNLKKEIEKIKNQRKTRRDLRKTSQIPVVSLVGYTNSGKSTLLNALTNAGVLVQDKLFATLDPTIRRLNLPENKTVLLTDTVGFIQKLPHQLIEAFSATLEEVNQADLLLHIVDASAPNFNSQIEAVYMVLEELKAITKPIITIFNKIDQLPNQQFLKPYLQDYHPAVAISALKKENLEELLLNISAYCGGHSH